MNIERCSHTTYQIIDDSARGAERDKQIKVALENHKAEFESYAESRGWIVIRGSEKTTFRDIVVAGKIYCRTDFDGNIDVLQWVRKILKESKVTEEFQIKELTWLIAKHVGKIVADAVAAERERLESLRAAVKAVSEKADYGLYDDLIEILRASHVETKNPTDKRGLDRVKFLAETVEMHRAALHRCVEFFDREIANDQTRIMNSDFSRTYQFAAECLRNHAEGYIPTDKEKFLALMREFGVGFREDIIRNGPCLSLRIDYYKNDPIRQYSVYGTTFEFGPDDKFIQLGSWE